jgi:hypothetical protein
MAESWKNRVTELFGSDYPIMSGPMREDERGQADSGPGSRFVRKSFPEPVPWR